MYYLLFFATFSFIDSSFSSPPTDYVLVQTKVGLIRGLIATDGNYNMFMGIPYAAVDPRNPFGLHSEPQPFKDVFDATKEPVKCIQHTVDNDEDNNMSIDCLQLNIYVPESASINNTLPVLLYIYGGGYTEGWSGRPNAGPKFIVRHDVIFVTLNYRLGPYGFMCLDVPTVPGNQGLKDQIAGIKWIKQNIAEFGGDGDKITIMGDSAGGQSVDFILRFSEPNFIDKVIMLSGCYNHWILPKESNYQYALNLAKDLGYEANTTTEALDFLATVNPQRLLSASSLHSHLAPCIEKYFPDVNRLVTEDPATAKIPHVKNTHILIGYANEEMNYFAPTNRVFYSDAIFESVTQSLNIPIETAPVVEKMLKRFYIGDVSENEMKYEDLVDFVHYLEDYSFLHITERAIETYIKNEALKVYRFMFSYSGNRNPIQVSTNMTFKGAAHGDILGYLFDLEVLDQPITSEDQLKIDQITTMWANFVKHGDPTPETSDLLPVKWPPVTPNISYNMNIGKALVVDTRPFYDRMAFWDLLYELANNQD